MWDIEVGVYGIVELLLVSSFVACLKIRNFEYTFHLLLGRFDVGWVVLNFTYYGL